MERWLTVRRRGLTSENLNLVVRGLGIGKARGPGGDVERRRSVAS